MGLDNLPDNSPQTVLGRLDSQTVVSATGGRRQRWWTTPVSLWALVGLVFIAFQIWVYARWIADGGLHSITTGTDHVSAARATLIVGWQVLMVIALVIVTTLVIRDCRRHHTITAVAALYAGSFATAWQDPLFNYRELVMVQSHYAVNLFTWGPYIPGWHGPHPEQQVEAMISGGGLAYFVLIIWIWIPLTAITFAARRYPHLGRIRLYLCGVAAGTLGDYILEWIWLPTGSYASPAAIPVLTFPAGEWYQVPLTFGLIISITLSAPLAVMIHTMRQNGEFSALHGSTMFPDKTRTWMRLLAGTGVINIACLAFMIATNLLTYFGGPIPSSMPSHLWPVPN
ncbi:spirocyclase AveC family protein [Streptomyces sp. NPDC006733]|uniref:spirocyclase AveC family protein n=1 Tax=Streptomyces sp. NPDC006733 TaxID=3155460 RepID=UPI00340244D8